jgi:hypothetical protein
MLVYGHRGSHGDSRHLAAEPPLLLRERAAQPHVISHSFICAFSKGASASASCHHSLLEGKHSVIPSSQASKSSQSTSCVRLFCCGIPVLIGQLQDALSRPTRVLSARRIKFSHVMKVSIYAHPNRKRSHRLRPSSLYPTSVPNISAERVVSDDAVWFGLRLGDFNHCLLRRSTHPLQSTVSRAAPWRRTAPFAHLGSPSVEFPTLSVLMICETSTVPVTTGLHHRWLELPCPCGLFIRIFLPLPASSCPSQLVPLLLPPHVA